MRSKRTLILGIGNWLMGDEGLGVHLARRMESMELPSHVDVLDGGTGGFHLLGHLEGYGKVVIVDATLDGLPPGTVRSIRPRFASDFPLAMSTHDIGLKDLVGALQLLDRMPDIELWVVSIDSLQQQTVELGPVVNEAVEGLTHRILSSLRCGPPPVSMAADAAAL